MDWVSIWWILINGTALVVSLWAVRDARQSMIAVRALNGRARFLTARGAIRREVVRTLISALLVVVAIPSLLDDRVTHLSIPVILLVAVTVLMLVNIVGDTVDRRLVIDVLEREARTERRRSTDDRPPV